MLNELVRQTIAWEEWIITGCCIFVTLFQTMLGLNILRTRAIVSKILSLVLYGHMQYHNDTIIKTQEDFFIKICTSHFIVRFVCERELETENKLLYFDPTHSYGRQHCVFLVLQMLNRRPRGPLCWVMAFFTASYQHLLWTPIQSGAPSPFSLVWLSLPQLVYNSIRSLTAWLLSWLSYIIVERPLSHLLDFWNRMLDRHQAEITVMQFTGHSLPVHQSMSVPWEFFTSSHFISQFPPTRFPLITAIRMCHFLPVYHSEWHFWPGRRSKYHTGRFFCLKITGCFLIWPLTRCNLEKKRFWQISIKTKDKKKCDMLFIKKKWMKNEIAKSKKKKKKKNFTNKNTKTTQHRRRKRRRETTFAFFFSCHQF